MTEGENTLMAAVFAMEVLQTSIQNVPVKIEETTEYPYHNRLVFKIETEKHLSFRLKIRKSEWAKSIETKEKYQLENDFLVFDLSFSKNDQIELKFQVEVQIKED